MNSEAYFKAAASLNDHYSWKTFSKHVVSIEVDKESNHECEVEDLSENIKTNLIDKWLRTQMMSEHVINQKRQRLMTMKKDFVRKLTDET